MRRLAGLILDFIKVYFYGRAQEGMMKYQGKSICSLIMIFVFILFTSNQCATTRAVKPNVGRGADLVIIKKDGSSVRGELLAVNGNLLLVQKRARNSESLGISEIKEIQVEYLFDSAKKSSVGDYIGRIIGGFFFLGTIGGAAGYLVTEGKSNENIEDLNDRRQAAAIGAAVGGILGIIFGISTASSSRPKRTKITYNIEGASEEEVQKTLNYLSVIARNR